MTSNKNILGGGGGVPILGPLKCFPSLLNFYSRDANGDFSTSTSTLVKENSRNIFIYFIVDLFPPLRGG